MISDFKETHALDAIGKPFAELPDVYLFTHLDPDQRAKIAATQHTHVLEKDQLLFQHGDPARRFFLVQQGHIKLYRLSPEGHEKIIEIISPGRTFAEAVMFMEKKRYPVSAEALEPSIVLSFDNEVFRQNLKESPETCFQLMATMSQRLHARLNEIDGLCLHNATFRLVNYLLQQVPQDEFPHSQVHLDIPKGVIASRLAIQRETLSRILSKLRDQGLIEVRGQNIILRNVKALRTMVCA